MVAEGDAAPDFTLPDQDGNEVTPSDLRGRPVVLYFYPKDDTPGGLGPIPEGRWQVSLSGPS